jgi:predicted NUDIX family phosphoesterase
MMERLSRIRKEDRTNVEEFLLSPEWRRRITGVIVMTTSPDDAMQREQGHLPVQTTGSIMNKDVLRTILDTTHQCAEEMKTQFRIRNVNTSDAQRKDNPKATAEVVADQILNWIEEDLLEDILHLPKSRICTLFNNQISLRGSAAQPVLEAFSHDGRFKPREEVEADASVVQALPVVVVRRNNGDVLRLKRHEKKESNALHEKIVIWAGGHVRREDGENGEAVRRGAQRELQEELRLNVELDQLQFLGAIYADPGNGTSKHAALVFEWRAETDDVAVTLSSAEFFERRGTSLSGTFVPLQQLAKDVSSGQIPEVWSAEIVRELLGLALPEKDARLF